ncbi:hypothetical protein A2716_05250 [candidate division WWE3 bacterium RIFCSPHIGHO2_01_FULL_40_23]|uniref:Uncharacterized protein n=1 Tax=candidate division WWE3 bacterium RIFCSPLOWO2_01_FULL_41_18 TaxID=1802625 RepID=A0A1F4VDC3_UNCKA|nr:MAG: hypothetical protein A2716_05250 [candidate division WWE3 bacterium RIFCSPHIGHO2_01_FULL_40_23]OGC55276.1 MAG: hypothetical protein A3A78_04860 [candidate division WWE3 bacterium RIFCSPLOWO2_01_FULL_41_18]
MKKSKIIIVGEFVFGFLQSVSAVAYYLIVVLRLKELYETFDAKPDLLVTYIILLSFFVMGILNIFSSVLFTVLKVRNERMFSFFKGYFISSIAASLISLVLIKTFVLLAG